MPALNINDAKRMDREDPLRSCREKFIITDDRMIYLDGNSLGRLPLQTTGDLEKMVHHAWGDRLIRSWNEGWYTRSAELGDRIAGIAGASEGEIIVSDSTSVNLYKLASAALMFKKGRKKIISDDLNFPSDLYIFQGLIEQLGGVHELVILHSEDGMTISDDQLEQAIDEDTALVSLSHVVFKSAFMYDMQKVTEMARVKGALVLWDLSHSIGAVEVQLNASGAELAVGCTYKYLNGGPGSPAFLYVKKGLQEQLQSPVWGWFGEQAPFEFGLNYRPGAGIRRFLAGTPPILSMVPMERTLEMMMEAGMDRIRKKSMDQSSFLQELVAERLYPLDFKPGSPLEAQRRGSHLTLRHPEAYRISQAMIDPTIGNYQVIPDFREPDHIRLGITPLYTTFEELFHAVEEMERIVRDRLYERISGKRGEVT